MRKFAAQEWIRVNGIGFSAITSLDDDLNTRDEIVGHKVDIDGEVFTVRGVDLLMHMPPWRKGETVGLLVVLDS